MNSDYSNWMGIEESCSAAGTKLNSKLVAGWEWLQTGEWSIHIFLQAGAAVGYAAHQTQPDHYEPDQQVVFLRH